MNKKELILKYEGVFQSIGMNLSTTIKFNELWDDILKLDEPQKVKVPQFVAEHIEWTKEEDFHLLGAMSRENFDKKLEDWFYTDDNMELFARAWLDGYEVEKEKRYIIKLKGVPNGAKFLKYAKVTQEWYFGMKRHYNDIEVSHTRKELEEAGFGWVFDCDGIEVEEVEG